MRTRRASAVLAGAIILVGLTGGLTPARAARGAPARAPRPRALATLTVDLVDPTRATPATPGHPGTAERDLVTRIRYPKNATRALPLVVLAHGRNGDPEQLTQLTDAWARAGMVVAAPRFPRANLDDRGKALRADAAEYPADMSFVITRVLAMGAAATGPLHGLVDPRHIGAGGVSLGGMAVYGLVSNTCCLDARVDAALLMSAIHPEFPTGTYERQRVPVMLVHGDADGGYRYSRQTYPTLAPPKWFVTLRHGLHGPPFEDEPSEHDDLVRAVTAAFWQRYLGGDAVAAGRIVREVARSKGKATLRRDLG